MSLGEDLSRCEPALTINLAQLTVKIVNDVQSYTIALVTDLLVNNSFDFLFLHFELESILLQRED